MYKHILVPTDGSALSLKAAKAAAGLAKSLGARITALHVTAPYMPPVASESALLRRMDEMQADHRKTTEAQARKALDKVERIVAASKVGCTKLHVTDEQAWDGIIRTAAQKKCDLIVMASRGRKGLAGLLLGSETVKVLTHSKTPVLVCR